MTVSGQIALSTIAPDCLKNVLAEGNAGIWNGGWISVSRDALTWKIPIQGQEHCIRFAGTRSSCPPARFSDYGIAEQFV